MDGIDWASSAMAAAQSRLDIATGNLANVSTDGFRAVVARGSLTAHGVSIGRTDSGAHGGLRHTGRDFDFAIVGDGVFRVQDDAGHVTATRNGAFTRDRMGVLRDDAGRAVLGLRGVLRVPEGATIDASGRVLLGGRQIDCLVSGPHPMVRSGFIESANVNAIGEMVTVMTSQRSFESAQKVVTAIDGTRQKSANEVARLK
jgi:flagellar basal body rod protein FlgG